MTRLTQQEWLNVIDYDPLNGTFQWKDIPEIYFNKRGKPTGLTGPKGHKTIRHQCVAYRAHWVAWVIMTGSYPVGEIDHINGDRGDNSFKNLREASRLENQRNRILGANNTSGFKGVIKRRYGGFEACIQVNRKKVYLGKYETAEEAARAHDAGAIKHFGAFAKTNKQLGLIP